MKNFKKFAAMVSALALASCAVAPVAVMTATAADATILDFTAPDNANIASLTNVKALQIFTATVDSNGGLNITDWGTGLTDIEKLAIAKAAGAVASDASSLGDVIAVDVALKINADNAAAVAAAVANNTTGTAGTVDAAAKKVKWTNGLDNGYYSITCQAQGDDEENSKYTAYSLGMLTVINGKVTKVGALDNGEAKVALPKVEKKVLEDDNAASENATYEKNDAKWNDVADYEIGQEVKFGLYGTLPGDYEEYDHYYYKFVDKLDGSFEKPVISDFKVFVGERELIINSTLSTDLEIDIDGDTTNGWSINVTFNDLKKANIDKDTVIKVYYKTALTARATVNKAQKNDVYLVYSNNPNKSGDGDFDKNTGETPKDEAGVYTYELLLEKKFFNNGSDLTEEEIKASNYADLKFSVEGKKFKKVEEGDADYGKYDYILDENGTVKELTLTLIDNKGDIVPTPVTPTTNVEGYKLVIRIKGVDSTIENGEYKVTEDNTAWTDYDVISEANGKITVTSDITYSQNEKVFKDAGSSYGAVGDNYYDLNNTKGLKLPGTGGIGTTLFYLGGGAMVACAGIFLITKKRTGEEE